ncbi:DUF4352 domain-containing protein [Micromonospora sp. IBHARD004]|uniref:DUF4352 domain-containing protein n=1 Tax=Micromonospora sp. IBHARD004 TaxID=3457764 RepID=UPI00405A1113
MRGGDFEFTVNSVRCGISQVGSSYFNHKAQGTFCRVSVTAKNVTKSATCSTPTAPSPPRTPPAGSTTSTGRPPSTATRTPRASSTRSTPATR